MARAARVVTGSTALVLLFLLIPPFLLPEALYALSYGVLYPRSWSVGDGTLTDHGPDAATDRLVIDLGELDLRRAGVRRYRIDAHPRFVSAPGLQLTAATGAVRMLVPPSLRVTLTILDDEGRVLCEASPARVADWEWSQVAGEKRAALVYPPSCVREWGLAGCTVVVGVAGGESLPDGTRARLLLAGGGWKQG